MRIVIIFDGGGSVGGGPMGGATVRSWPDPVDSPLCDLKMCYNINDQPVLIIGIIFVDWSSSL